MYSGILIASGANAVEFTKDLKPFDRTTPPFVVPGPGPTGPTGPTGPVGATGPGSLGSVYVLPGPGNGSYIVFPTANSHVLLNVTCNYGFAGDNEVLFVAGDPSVTAGSVSVMEEVNGVVLAFNDLVYGAGGMDRSFPNSGNQGTWPWHGVFTVAEGGIVTRWELFVNGSSGNDCTVIAHQSGSYGTPQCGPSCTKK